MDFYQLLLFIVCAAVIIAVALLSKKTGYKLPLVLGIVSLFFSIYFFVTPPEPSGIIEEPLIHALYQMGFYLGLLFALSFFFIAFSTFKRKGRF